MANQALACRRRDRDVHARRGSAINCIPRPSPPFLDGLYVAFLGRPRTTRRSIQTSPLCSARSIGTYGSAPSRIVYHETIDPDKLAARLLCSAGSIGTYGSAPSRIVGC